MPGGPRVSILMAVAAFAGAVVHGAAVTTQEQAPTKVLTALPAGAGQKVAARICLECHSVIDITRRRESRFAWTVIVDDMVGEGARITDDEFEILVSYLSVTLGRKVKINQADARVVAETFDFEPADAEKIVKVRRERGPFKTWQEIAAVPGIDAKRVEEQKGNLDFSASSASPRPVLPAPASSSVVSPRRR